MRSVLSRFVAVLALATAVLALQPRASAATLPYRARGAAQFVNANDFVGSGNATYLGKYTETGTVAFAATNDPNVLAVDGSAVYTAADGDELHALLGGELNVTTGVIAVTVTYVGGTGRFAAASGSSSLAGQMLGGGAATVAVAGNIDF
jgi:hypothetical protein